MARMKLTAAAVDRIKPPATGRTEYWDLLLPGFVLRVTANGAKSWAVMYRVHGRRRRYTLGSYPNLSLAKARERAKAAFEAIAIGGDPGAAKADRRASRVDAFESVVANFIERYAKPNNRSWAVTAALFNRHVLPRWGDLDINTIRKRDVVELLDAVHDDRGPYAANRTLAAIRKLFNWAVERDIIDGSPCAGVKAPGKERQRDRVLADDEIMTLWAAWDQMMWPWGPFCKLLLVTAQRRDEVAHMRWPDFDLGDAKRWTLPRELTKNDRAHEVPLSPLAVDIIESCPRFDWSDYVFASRLADTDNDRPVSGFGGAKARTEVLTEAPIADWRLHDLRRTAATNMARLGVGVDIIGRVLNHASGHGVTGIYDRHSYLPEKERALAVWANRLESIIRPDAEERVVSISGARVGA